MSFGGISDEGSNAEDRFCSLTGASPAPRSRGGDALLDGHLVEVKKTTGRTVNQVRAVKYLPVAVFSEPSATWYVIPAHQIVVAVARKQRGQHTENPFESTTLDLSNFYDTAVRDPASNLKSVTLAAIAASGEFPELHDVMAEVLRTAQQTAREAHRRVSAVLARTGLDRRTKRPVTFFTPGVDEIDGRDIPMIHYPPKA